MNQLNQPHLRMDPFTIDAHTSVFICKITIFSDIMKIYT
jgi:hypothetical protein